MNVSVQHYFPPHIQQICEFQALGDVYDVGLVRLWNTLGEVYGNQYLDTLAQEGCQRLERMLGIIPRSNDSLEVRRERIKLRWMKNLPYTPNALRESIEAIIQRDEYRLDIRPVSYEIELLLFNRESRFLKEIRGMALDMIPANMILVIAGQYPLDIPVEIKVGCCLALTAGFYGRYNREFLYLDGSWLLDGACLLNGYKVIEGPDLYPARAMIRGEWLTPVALTWQVGYWADVEGLPKTEADMRIVSETAGQLVGDAGLGLVWAQPVTLGVGCRLTVENDLWYLDGSYLLDGTKLLDAEIFEYEL